jgi:hypothetical protein
MSSARVVKAKAKVIRIRALSHSIRSNNIFDPDPAIPPVFDPSFHCLRDVTIQSREKTLPPRASVRRSTKHTTACPPTHPHFHLHLQSVRFSYFTCRLQKSVHLLGATLLRTQAKAPISVILSAVVLANTSATW